MAAVTPSTRTPDFPARWLNARPRPAWIRKTRWDALTTQDQDRFSHIIIELRPPSDNLAELHVMLEQRIANGVEVAWLIDPFEHTVSIYRPGDSLEVHHHPTLVQGSGVVAGFELVRARVWS